jgi:multidrug efflux pump subunit AcrA (membrane-fusion protein)
MNRRAALGICAVAVLAAGTLFVLQRRNVLTAPAASFSAASAVPVASAVFAHYVIRLRAQGRVGVPSGGEAKLAFANAGIVARVDVRVGEAVQAGQPLAELDTAGITLDVAQARGDAVAAAASYGGGSVAMRALAAAQARLVAARSRLHALETGTASAQSDREAALAAVRQSMAKLGADGRAADRATRLYAGGVTALKDVEAARADLLFDRAEADVNRARLASAGSSIGEALAQAHADVAQGQSDVQSARAQISVAAAQAESARARYAAAQRTLAVATLAAAADGVVTAILKHPGEAVDPTQAAIVVGPARTSDVSLTVLGADARRVQPGDAVTITAADPGRSGRGRVRAVVRGVDPSTQTTIVTVTGTPPNAVSGDFVAATIDVGERSGIVIPTSAIVEDPENGSSIVFVLERTAGGTQRFVPRKITIDSGDDQRTLLRTGLHAGERVAAQGAFDLLAPSGGG